MSNALSPGLENVVAAETRLSHVDGDAGMLVIDGELVETLAGRASFEQLCARLWHEEVVSLGELRVAAFQRLSALSHALAMPDGMAALRAFIGALPSTTTFEEITASVGVFTAAWCRQQAGQSLIPPDRHLAHAADVLRMIRGEVSAALATALDSYLVTVIDHGFNASTFAARVVASTNSDTVSSVTAAIGALKGPLHGGAPGPVLDMLDAIGEPARAESWLLMELSAGRRIMGMGHRIYRVRDPRAAVLERAIEALEKNGISTPRLGLARAVERTARDVLQRKYPQRELQANVEFYTAVLLDVLGVPRQAFSMIFATGRVAGWCAHIAEQRATGRLIRPASRYVGSMPVMASSKS